MVKHFINCFRLFFKLPELLKALQELDSSQSEINSAQAKTNEEFIKSLDYLFQKRALDSPSTFLPNPELLADVQPPLDTKSIDERLRELDQSRFSLVNSYPVGRNEIHARNSQLETIEQERARYLSMRTRAAATGGR